MAKRFTKDFIEGMKKFYRANKNATLAQARKQAAQLDYDELSQAAHDRFRKEAGVKTQRARAGKASAGEQEAPKQCWMDLSTGEFNTDFDSGQPGTKVAIYRRVAMGTINLAYPKRHNGSLKAA